jgi:hypothetical protein
MDMHFRLKAFSLHLLSSAVVLTLILGGLYFGWYRWPGWYLTNVSTVVLVMVCVDVVLGPTLTMIIANKNKPRRELARDISIIVAVQLCALVYGSVQLWNGRPLYYVFSQNALSVVQAYDITNQEADLGRQQNSAFAPHWYSLPRWAWAPLPQDPKERQALISETAAGVGDVSLKPRYYKPWEQGLTALRDQLNKLDDSRFFSAAEKKKLTQRMQADGVATDEPLTLPFTGRTRPLLAVFSRSSLQITAMFKPR